MLNYIIRRILIVPFLLFGVTILIFSMISLMKPLDRAQALFTTDDPGRRRDFEGLISKYGLDDPIQVQYWNWLVGIADEESGEIKGGVLRGNLGWSQVGRSSIVDVIKNRLPATAELVLWSLGPIIWLSIWMGVKAAEKHNKLFDQTMRIVAITGWSIPQFIFGLLLLFFFTAQYHIFPPGRLSVEIQEITYASEFIHYTNMNTIDALLNFNLDVFVDSLRHLFLPIITLSIAHWAFLLRITRFSMLDVLNQDYIHFARSKGLSEKWIVRKHALPNALIPVITVGGLTFVSLFNGVLVTETIFNYPGLGAFLAEAAVALDLISIAGVTLFSCVILVLGNLAVDVLYVVADPRIRLD